MIKIFDTPEYMTVDEVVKKFYPCYVVLANCEVEYHAPKAGYAMAMETHHIDDYDELFDYLRSLCPKTYKETYMIATRMPHEREWLDDKPELSNRIEERREADLLSLLRE